MDAARKLLVDTLARRPDLDLKNLSLTIGRNQRYSAAVASAGSAGGFAFGMQQAGYSTDPTYGEKLARVIRTASSIGGTG